jgi:hypothetical protein
VRPSVLAVVAVQVLVPVTLLGVRWEQEGTRPRTELGASWQMYSSAPAPHYLGEDAEGRAWPLAVDALPPVVREVAIGRTVPGRLCAAHPALVAVVRVSGPDPGRYAC